MKILENYLNEIFTTPPSFSEMPTGLKKDIQMLRTSIIAEYDAANLYEQFAELADDERVSIIMTDIANEEKQHVGEFKLLLDKLDPEGEGYVEKGEDEAEEKTS